MKAVLLGLEPSFGFGDRIGLATRGHVAAMVQGGDGILPIFPQQSIREMTRTARTPGQVMQDAFEGMRAAEWPGVTGADADHLKTREDVERTAEAGFTFFTIDPSDDVDGEADAYDEQTLERRFSELSNEVSWVSRYEGRRITLETGTVVAFDHLTVMRAAVKYGSAINAGVALARHIREVQEGAHRDYEIELSVDETDEPTSLAEHVIIAEQCLEQGMKLVSLAPRFIGELEKGVDYIGDVEALERSLRDHAAIAKMLGPYKLSLHSGSDKLSMYTAFARATEGRFHVKTAGTSYLEALRVAARCDSALFRRICDFARSRYDEDRATYHVHAQVADVPPPADVGDDKALERIYLECWEDVQEGYGFTASGRQVLHCTFGSVLTDPDLGQALRSCLETHLDTYTEVLAQHFGRHLAALKRGL